MTALKPCGTRAAFLRHIRRNEDPCQACVEETKRYTAAKGQVRTTAWQRLKEQHPDEFAALRSSYPGDPNGWQRAMSALAAIYPQEHAALVVECRAERAREQRQAVAS